MTKILKRLGDVFQEVFDDDDLVISPQTTARDVDAWDSLMHVDLLLTVEKEFGVRFSSFEVAALKDVRELITLIESKTNNDQQAL